MLGLGKYTFSEQEKPAFAKSKSLVFQILLQENKAEYYTLTVTKNGILVSANDPKGFFMRYSL